MAGGSNAWACSACRSINVQRADRCYKCHAPRQVVGTAPTALPTVGSATVAPITTRYRSSRIRAATLVVLLLAFGVVSLVRWSLATEGLTAIANGDPVSLNLADQLGRVLVALIGVGVAALVAWAAWISRVVENLPALGGGYLSVTPRLAFVECLIPGWNLIKLPGHVIEVIHRLDARGGVGTVSAAWLAIVGAFLTEYVLDRVLAFTTLGSQRSYADAIVVVHAVTAPISALGFVFLVLAVIRVERLAAECHRREMATRAG